jgi:hypothetical protein
MGSCIADAVVVHVVHMQPGWQLLQPSCLADWRGLLLFCPGVAAGAQQQRKYAAVAGHHALLLLMC